MKTTTGTLVTVKGMGATATSMIVKGKGATARLKY